ncbi:hypothetical protein DL768_001249 [Monosporascus sp. mg162]|nr:hypothetical protein DL768_001249 [Monosporascus sp. mg162]
MFGVVQTSAPGKDEPQSTQITPSLVKAEPEPRKQVAPSTTNSAPPVRPAITASTTPPLPASPAPTTSTPQPASPNTTTCKLQGRLWNEAYDDLKKKEPKLVDAYERLLSRELSEGDSSSTDETSQKNEIEQTNSKTRRSQMVRLVQAGLKKTEKEAAVKHDIQEKMHAVSSVKELIDAAVKLVPEAAIAWTGACFALQMLANPIDEAGANRDGIAYVVSRMDWYWELSSLLLDENRADGKSARLRGELEKHIIDLYKKLLLYQMKSACLYYRNWLVVVLRDMVKLDDWENTLQSIKVAENTIRQDSDAYNTEKIQSHLEDLLKAAESRRAMLHDIYRAIQDQTAAQREMRQENKNEKCLQALFLTDPRNDKRRIEETKGGLFRDSSNWILGHEDFRRWRDDDGARLLWIKGDPGKGKTMLLIAIVDELEQLKQPHQQSTTVLSYFFCQGTNSDLNNATAVLRGLIFLLIMQQPLLISHLREKYDHQGQGLFQGINAFVALSGIFGSMLRDPKLTRAYIVVDALDECETNQKQLLNLIAQNISASPRVKWIVSSRNQVEVEQQLKLDDSGMKLSLELTQNAQQVAHAVNAYINSKVKEVKSLQDDDEERDRIRDVMHQKANGTFLWVTLIIKELEKPDCLDPLQVVKEIPTDLYELYNRILNQIWQLQKSTSEFCQLVLSVVTLAYRPLHLAELIVLSGLHQKISIKKVRKVVEFCGSFLTIQNDHVYLIHQSVKDYLSSKASSTIFPSGPTDVHHAICSRSLQAMSTSLHRNIYNLHPPGLLIGEIKAPDPDPLAAIRYSCVHWIGHFCDAYSNSRPEVETVGHFLREKFLYWLEALGFIQHMGDAILSITRLKSLLKLLASASDDRTIKIWDAATGSLQQTIEGHKGSVRSVAFSHDSKLLASASGDGTIKIWDAATGSLQQTLEGHKGPVNSVAFSHDSKLLASASDDRTIKIWDAATGSLQQTLEGHKDPVRSVAFSHDSKLLASASYDRTIKIWDAATGSLQQTLELGTIVQTMSFDNTGLYLDTNIGHIDLAVGTKKIQLLPRTPYPDQANEAQYYGYALSRDRSWITWNKHNVLWLPTDYRPFIYAISSFASSSTPSTVTRIGLGYHSGRVVVIGLLDSGLL